MGFVKKCLLMCLLMVAGMCVEQYFSDYRQGFAAKKGLTFQATVWPEEKNSYVGRMSCNGCDPNEGDTACTEILPVTCILQPMKLDRPWYSFYPSFTPYTNPDSSYYEGWTGGVIALTDPVRGLEIDSYITGNRMCQNAFGADAKFATFTDGYYMPYMNGPTISIEKTWDWSKAKRGEYNFWGVFAHNHIGRSWIWTQTTPSGNCMLPNTNPITGGR